MTSIGENPRVEELQLIQATLTGAKARSERLLYVVQVDLPRIRQSHEARDEQGALSSAIRNVQSMIASAFPKCLVDWAAAVPYDLGLPNYDPICKMDGVNVWVLPVVSKNEAYFYLVG